MAGFREEDYGGSNVTTAPDENGCRPGRSEAKIRA